MLALQILSLVLGILGGLWLASRLRRLTWDVHKRQLAVVAFGAGVGAWVAFALIALPEPFLWCFLGTVFALYLPCLIVLLAPRHVLPDAAPKL